MNQSMMTKKKIQIKKTIKILNQVKRIKKKAMIMKAGTTIANLHQPKKRTMTEDMRTKCTKTK
jgi:hypothetical protein